MTNALGYFS